MTMLYSKTRILAHGSTTLLTRGKGETVAVAWERVEEQRQEAEEGAATTTDIDSSSGSNIL